MKLKINKNNKKKRKKWIEKPKELKNNRTRLEVSLVEWENINKKECIYQLQTQRELIWRETKIKESESKKTKLANKI